MQVSVGRCYNRIAFELLENLNEKQQDHLLDLERKFLHGQRFAKVDAIERRLEELQMTKSQLANELDVKKDRLTKQLHSAGRLVDRIVQLPEFSHLKKKLNGLTTDRRKWGWRYAIAWTKTVVLEKRSRSVRITPIPQDEYEFIVEAIRIETSNIEDYEDIWKQLPGRLLDIFSYCDLPWFERVMKDKRPAYLLVAKELNHA